MELIKKMFFLCLFTIPFFNGYNFSYVLILWTLFVAYNAIKTKTYYINRIGLSLSAIFLVALSSLFFSKDISLSTSIIQPQLSIFIFGLSSIVYKYQIEDLENGFHIYVFSSIIAVLFSFYYFDVFHLLQHINSTNTFNNSFRDGIQSMPYFGKHPIYFALISVISTLISFNIIFKNQNIIIKIINVFNILIQFVFIVLLAAKMSLLLLSCGIFIMVYSYLKEKKYKILFLFSFLSGVFLLFQLPIIKTRFLEYQNYGVYKYPYKEYYNSISIRNALNKCSYEMGKEHFLFGVGLGNDILLMKNCLSTNFDSSFDDKDIYNEHNQYIAFLLRFGVLGIIIIGAPFIFSFNRFKNVSNPLLGIISLVIGISMMTENILDRSVGAYIFSFYMFLNSHYE